MSKTEIGEIMYIAVLVGGMPVDWLASAFWIGWTMVLINYLFLQCYHWSGAGMASNHLAHIHPAICIVAAFLLIFMLQISNVGFWVIGGLFTFSYASVFGFIACSDGDMIWGVVMYGLTLLIVGGLHLNARKQLE